MKEIVEELKNYIKQPLQDPDHALLPFKAKSITFSAENFHELPEAKSKSITFLDGGNAELISTPEISVHFNRLVSLTFNIDKKINKKEFFTIIKSEKVDENINYSIKCIPDFLPPQSINSNDSAFTLNHKRAEMTAIADYIRRCAELEFAKDSNTLLILDGSLYTPYLKEKELMQELLAKTKVVAVSKTCSWLTSSGIACIAAIAKRSKNSTWYYYPIAETDYNIAFAKFHNKSNHIFKIETKEDLQEILPVLVSQTNDAAFLGYPYGLLLADKLARVSQKEQEQLILKLRIMLKNNWNSLKPALNSTNAHSILDSI